MSFFSTLGDILNKVESDLDLKEETFIDRPELIDYVNEAIRTAEAEIHTIYEDYFLTSKVISLVPNIASYDLPADIYANKIRGIVYDDGTYSYQIKRQRNFSDIPLFFTGDYYEFRVVNSSLSGRKLMLFPTPVALKTNALTLWYLRSAKKLLNDSDVCDIVEFVNFILAHVKYSCMKKEGHPLLGEQMQAVEKEKQLMVDTLTNMIVDDDNKIVEDITIYEEHS